MPIFKRIVYITNKVKICTKHFDTPSFQKENLIKFWSLHLYDLKNYLDFSSHAKGGKFWHSPKLNEAKHKFPSHNILLLCICIILLFMFWTYLFFFFLPLIVYYNFLLKCSFERETQKFHWIRHSADEAYTVSSLKLFVFTDVNKTLPFRAIFRSSV